MRRNRYISREDERGVVVILVAVFLVFVVGAMAVLAIDVVTFYNARSEAQLAADAAALAGARVMANSGATSNPAALRSSAEGLATAAALQVAAQNKVGGRLLNTGVNCSQEVCVDPTLGLPYNPRIKVQVTKNDLPTFFARIFGRTQVTVSASATAEAYNPSGANVSINPGGPVSPVCVKPWLLPNLDPTGGGGAIFNSSGTIITNSLVGQSWPGGSGNGLSARCKDCSPGGGGIPPLAIAGKYYPAAVDPTGVDPQQFPEPLQSLPAGSAGFTSYQLAVVGCVPRPIACGLSANFKIDDNTYTAHTVDRDTDAVEAAKILIHDKGNNLDSDSIDLLAVPSPPLQFLAGNENPIAIANASAAGHNVAVSDSLVTVPVFDSSLGVSQPVQIIGFLQLFLNPQGTPVTGTDIPATVVNMAGCGTTATGQPVMGNGNSVIPVRLVASSP